MTVKPEKVEISWEESPLVSPRLIDRIYHALPAMNGHVWLTTAVIVLTFLQHRTDFFLHKIQILKIGMGLNSLGFQAFRWFYKMSKHAWNFSHYHISPLRLDCWLQLPCYCAWKNKLEPSELYLKKVISKTEERKCQLKIWVYLKTIFCVTNHWWLVIILSSVIFSRVAMTPFRWVTPLIRMANCVSSQAQGHWPSGPQGVEASPIFHLHDWACISHFIISELSCPCFKLPWTLAISSDPAFMTLALDISNYPIS